MKKNKIIAGILCGTLCFSAVPMTASAETTTSVTSTRKDVEKSVKYVKKSVVEGYTTTVALKGVKKGNISISTTNKGVIKVSCSKDGSFVIKGIKEGTTKLVVKDKKTKKVLGRYNVTVKDFVPFFEKGFDSLVNLDEENYSFDADIGFSIVEKDEYSKDLNLNVNIAGARKEDKAYVDFTFDLITHDEESRLDRTWTDFNISTMFIEDKAYLNFDEVIDFCTVTSLIDVETAKYLKRAEIGWVVFTEEEVEECANAIIDELGIEYLTENGEIEITEKGLKTFKKAIGDFLIILDKNCSSNNLVKEKADDSYELLINQDNIADIYTVGYNIMNKDLGSYLKNTLKAFKKVKSDKVIAELIPEMEAFYKEFKAEKKGLLEDIKEAKSQIKTDIGDIKFTIKGTINEKDDVTNRELVMSFRDIDMNTDADITLALSTGKASKIDIVEPTNVTTTEELEKMLGITDNSIMM